MITKDTHVVVPGIDIINSEDKAQLEGHFTLGQALSKMANTRYACEFTNMMLYNIPLRDEMRERGVEAVLAEVERLAPEGDELKKAMDRFFEYHKEHYFGDIDLQLTHHSAPLHVFGHAYPDWHQYIEVCRRFGADREPHYYKDMPPADAPLHIGSLFEPYPCFDSDDYGSGDYNNYIIRQRPITADDFNEVAAASNHFNHCCVHEQTPLHLLPLAYRDGYSATVILATVRGEKEG